MADNSDSGETDESGESLPRSLNDKMRQGEADLTRQRMAETDRRYVKFKMKQIKTAKQNGNHGKAERHRIELLQFLGMA